MTKQNKSQTSSIAGSVVCEADGIHQTQIIPDRVGPNGHRTGLMSDGSIAELIPDDTDDNISLACTLVRGAEEMATAYGKYSELVWYERHLPRLGKGSELSLSTMELEIYKSARAAAHVIRRKHSVEELNMSAFDYGLASGRMSALAWFLGADWEVSLDTRGPTELNTHTA